MALDLDDLSTQHSHLRGIRREQILGVRRQFDVHDCTNGRQAAVVGDDKTCDRLVVAAWQVNAERTLGLIHVIVAGHHPRPVARVGAGGMLHRIVLIGDLADQFLG